MSSSIKDPYGDDRPFLTDPTTQGRFTYLRSLLAGEDQIRDVLRIVDGASQGVHQLPINHSSGQYQNSDVILGTTGAAGDLLKHLSINVSSATNAAVYLSQVGAAPLTLGTAGTSPAGTTTLAVTATTAFTATAKQHVGRIISVTYTPTSGPSVKIKRKVVDHAAFSAVTALSFTLSHAIPAGASITAWQLEPISSWEVVPFNAAVGMYNKPLGERSTIGGWQLSTDTGVEVHANGIFT